MPKRSARQWFRLFHKWAGLTAAAWLLVLGVTGVLLDHPDWRPLNQITVPESWGSPDLTQFIRLTKMRQVLVDPADDQRWLGASERGLWRSGDGGQNWRSLEFANRDYSPQVHVLLDHPTAGFDAALVATDEGLWQVASSGEAAPIALDDRVINSLSVGHAPGTLVGVADRSEVFMLDIDTLDVHWASMQPIEPVIADAVTLNRYVLNTHFGHGLAEGRWGILVNDFGGVALIVLPLTGFLYWFLRRRWRQRPAANPGARRSAARWLYRSHAPVIGVLAIVPILYLSLTGIVADHIRSIYEWTASITVPAALVPAGFSMRSLDDDVQDVVADPVRPGELLIATRKGLYRSGDGGRTWSRYDTIPIERADFGNSLHLNRVDDTLILAAGLGQNFHSVDGGATWLPIEGPFTGISSATRGNSGWYLKNSQGVFTGESPATVTRTAIENPPLEGMPLFLFLADVHTGHAIAPWFAWVNDFFALLAIVLVVSGPIIWWRRKW